MLERTAAESAALADELRNVLHQVEELVHAVGEDRDAAVVAARDRMSGVLDSAKGRLADLERSATRKAKKLRKAANSYVSDNPWTALSIGAGIGLLLGALLGPGGRRGRSEE